jgi:hypothetical protein
MNLAKIDINDLNEIEVDYKISDDKINEIENNINNKINKSLIKLQQNVFFEEEDKDKFADLFLENVKNKEYFYEFNKIDEKERKVKITLNSKASKAADKIITKNTKKTKSKKLKEADPEQNIQNIDKELKKYDSFLINKNKILTSKNIKKLALNTINYLLNTFFYVNNKIVFINKIDTSYSVFSEKDVKNFLIQVCKNKNLTYTNEKEKEVYLFHPENFITYIKIYNTYNNITFKNDIFAEKSEIKIDKDRKEIIFINNKILIRKPEKIDVNEKLKEEIIRDYKEHWEGKLNNFIDYIVAIRFANDRKLSYLNLNAPSNWGKSFLMEIFEELGISTEARITDLKEDKATGLSVNSILNSFIIFIDEFKKFYNYLFKYTHNLVIEEKFKQAVKVPVYSKILLNADESESFNYAVDEQIKNRVLIMKITNYTKLDDRKLFKQNSYIYKEVVKEYFYTEIKKRINYYIDLGKIDSVAASENKIKELAEKYKIKSDFNINDIIKETVIYYLQDLRTKDETKMNSFDREIKDKIIFEDSFVYIKTPIRTIMKILSKELDEAEYKKIEYKKAQLAKIFKTEVKTRRTAGQIFKGFKINFNEIFDEINTNNLKQIINDNDDKIL